MPLPDDTMEHRDVPPYEVHPPSYLQDTDPALVPENNVTAGKYWTDTSLGTGQWVLKVRNAGNTGWELVASGLSDEDIASLLANIDAIVAPVAATVDAVAEDVTAMGTVLDTVAGGITTIQTSLTQGNELCLFVDSVNGDDANLGLTETTCKRTIQAALNVAGVTRIFARPGLYREVDLTVKSNVEVYMHTSGWDPVREIIKNITFATGAGGTCTLTVTVNGVSGTTAALAPTMTAVQLRDALESLTPVGVGNVLAAKLGSVYRVEFTGTLVGAVPTMTINTTSLTGTPSVPDGLGVMQLAVVADVPDDVDQSNAIVEVRTSFAPGKLRNPLLGRDHSSNTLTPWLSHTMGAVTVYYHPLGAVGVPFGVHVASMATPDGEWTTLARIENHTATNKDAVALALKPGEWCYGPSGYVYLRLPGDENPMKHRLEIVHGKRLNTGATTEGGAQIPVDTDEGEYGIMFATGVTRVTLQGITFTGARTGGMIYYQGHGNLWKTLTHLTLISCAARYCYGKYIKPAATLSTVFGANADLTFTARSTGPTGNAITMTLVDTGAATEALAVAVVGTAITVTLERAANALVSTATQVKAALDATAGATYLVSTALKSGNNGTGVMGALVTTALAGGIDLYDQDNGGDWYGTGFRCMGPCTIEFRACKSYRNAMDGFSFAFGGDFTAYGCQAWRNRDNGISPHDGSYLAIVGGIYSDNGDEQIAGVTGSVTDAVNVVADRTPLAYVASGLTAWADVETAAGTLVAHGGQRYRAAQLVPIGTPAPAPGGSAYWTDLDLPDVIPAWEADAIYTMGDVVAYGSFVYTAAKNIDTPDPAVDNPYHGTQSVAHWTKRSVSHVEWGVGESYAFPQCCVRAGRAYRAINTTATVASASTEPEVGLNWRLYWRELRPTSACAIFTDAGTTARFSHCYLGASLVGLRVNTGARITLDGIPYATDAWGEGGNYEDEWVDASSRIIVFPG